MTILGIDTSTAIGSVGLLVDQELIAEHSLDVTQAHSSRLMPAINTILEWGDLNIKDIDALAVATGPGSFTGVRIAVATAKSICYAIKKPILAISTLEAIAYNLRYANQLICPILDARRDQVYTAIFQGGENLIRQTEDLCVPLAEILNRLDDISDSPVVFVGNGLHRYGEDIRRRLNKPVLVIPTFNVPRGANIAYLGTERFQSGNVDDYFSITPNYVRSGDP
ncbi:MAG: tRNA (adenosine(37)-N6)-threonylcarbamoyltransferase complex dimerization subunit type 1 TsaB [Candidatus Poribacteria bacterium]